MRSSPDGPSRRSPTAPASLLSLLALSLASLLAANDAGALTTPLPGATPYPGTGEPLRLPFPAGTAVEIVSGYGPSAGSSLHTNIDLTDRGNDYYALDLIYAGEADGGLGRPLVAAISGTVVKAGWATAGWSNFGQRVILRHDLGDGSTYHTLYAHMNAIDPAIVEGAEVRQGQVLGELGGSCMGALSCSSFSRPHVHFSIHKDSNIGGSGTGGSYGGNAVVPEPIDGYEDLARGQILTSMNTGAPPECGDGFCNGGESSDSCPMDCPRCEPIPPEGRVIDEAELCFSRGGDPTFWREEAAGWEGSLIWTHATDAADPDNFGVWELTFEEAGRYVLEVYTDGAWAQAQQARYLVTHAGGSEPLVLDQSAVDGWQTLGELEFAAGGGQAVRLEDNTGESFDLRRQLVFDAIRLRRADLPAGDGGVSGDAGVPRDAGTRPEVDGGCGCRAAGSGAPSRAPWLLLLIVAVALGRARFRLARRP